jgi:hypothetical protein
MVFSKSLQRRARRGEGTRSTRSSHLKYQRWLVDLSWLTLVGGANKSRFMSTACLQPSRNLMLFQYCLASIERSTGLRKIGMKKTSPIRYLEWTGMDAEISDIWNFRRRAKINLNEGFSLVLSVVERKRNRIYLLIHRNIRYLVLRTFYYFCKHFWVETILRNSYFWFVSVRLRSRR